MLLHSLIAPRRAQKKEQHFTFDKNLPTFANVKLDRTGRYLAVMEVRAERCRKEAARYAARAKLAQNKIDRTKAMVLCYLESHDLKQFETEDTTLRRQKNSQDSVIVSNPDAIPPDLKRYELKVAGDI